MQRLLFLSLLLIFVSCKYPQNHPKTAFDHSELPDSPIYSQPDAWSSHPEKVDEADLIPRGDIKGLVNGQENAKADVFYIHPTTFNSKEAWNQDLSDEKVNEQTDHLPLRHQASIFNGSCRVFAPRYRQATYGAFFLDDPKELRKVMMVAYIDVRNAFKYYLEHENNGRPIVIAGHSQGSMHGMMLLEEFFDGTELQKQLVAAYLPGWPISKEKFESISPCNEPGETGCLNTWNSYQWDYEPKLKWRYENAICTNPLNWKSDGTYAGKPCSKGMVLHGYNKIFPAVCDAQEHDGMLWLHKPKVPGGIFLTMKNYHIADYNLFWMDIRENVDLRVGNFVLGSNQASSKK